MSRELLSEFDSFKWTNRSVEFCFDSDIVRKIGVQAAMHAAQRRFLDLRAKPSAVMLPGPEKGVDDFLVKHGPDAYVKLPRAEFALTEPLWAYNERFAMIDYPAMVLSLENGQLYQPGQLRQTLLADRIEVVNRGGKPQMKTVFDEWQRWTLHRRYKGIDYAPGEPRDLPNGYYNRWRGWGVESTPGDVTPFLGLMEHLFRDEVVRRLAIQWFAHMVQKPREKVMSALVLYGDLHGTGKSLLSEIMMMVIGHENSGIVTNDALVSRFNDWLAFKLLIVGEEVRGREGARHEGDKLKAYITSSHLRVDEKGIRHYTVPNLARFLLLSNSHMPLYMESSDRRYITVKTDSKLGHARGTEIKSWAESGGASWLRHYLEHFDLADFSPAQPAPLTADKRAVIEAGRSGIESVVRCLMEDEDRPPLAMMKELRHFAEQELGSAAHEKALHNALESGHAIYLGRFRLNAKDRNAKERVWSLRGPVDCPDEASVRAAMKNTREQRMEFFGCDAGA